MDVRITQIGIKMDIYSTWTVVSSVWIYTIQRKSFNALFFRGSFIVVDESSTLDSKMD